jgi:hypothetical protein
MSGAVCMDCGVLFAPAGVRALCGSCELEDDLFRARMAARVREECERESKPRVVTYWAPGSNSRFGALRTMVIPAAPKVDPYGGPIR